ncbi:MAG: hypothetical protein HC888_15180 [Candidatus Competibacteraceae bacterium]|nr:hypothetical protein [Candidatus Competibacteraceae bacterium]
MDQFLGGLSNLFEHEGKHYLRVHGVGLLKPVAQGFHWMFSLEEQTVFQLAGHALGVAKTGKVVIDEN